MVKSMVSRFIAVVVAGVCGVSVVTLAAGPDARVVDAAMNRDRAGVASLLQHGADVNTAQGDGMTALHWAAVNGDVEMARTLLKAGANVRAQGRIDGTTPLALAARDGNASMVTLFLDAGADTNAATSAGITALMFAAMSGDQETVRALVDRGADVNAKEKGFEQTALILAAAFNRPEAINVLLKHGADPTAATKVRVQAKKKDGFGGPPPEVRTAVVRDQVTGKLVQQAVDQRVQQLDEGRKIPPLPMGGLTPLLYAARDGHTAAVRALLDGGVNINGVGTADQTSPLLMATINGHFDLAMYLLEHGADPKAASATGATPLYAAVNVEWAPKAFYPQPSTKQEKTTYMELMKALIARGANVNARLTRELWFTEYAVGLNSADATGATPFWRAAQEGDTDAMRLFLAHGADPTIATNEGVTPLLAASGAGFYGNEEHVVPAGRMPAVRLLVEELGADVNAIDTNAKGGYNVIHNAAVRGDNEMIEYLVSKGARVDVVSKLGETTADMANGPRQRVQPFPATVALLMKLGSKNSNKCLTC